MNGDKQDVDTNMTRQHAVAEVIELGEMLFDTVINSATRQPVEGEASDEALIEEMQAAANEFFTALRLLFETGHEAGKKNL